LRKNTCGLASRNRDLIDPPPRLKMLNAGGEVEKLAKMFYSPRPPGWISGDRFAAGKGKEGRYRVWERRDKERGKREWGGNERRLREEQMGSWGELCGEGWEV